MPMKVQSLQPVQLAPQSLESGTVGASLNGQAYERCINLLRGSKIDLGVYCVSLALSSGLLIWGVRSLVDKDFANTRKGSRTITSDTDAILALQPVMFLVAQSFTITTSWRDRTMFIEYDIARPTLVYVGQGVVFFVLALILGAHVLGNTIEPLRWKAFYAICSLWVTVSALLISKWTRDRNYASIFESVHEDDMKEIFDKVIGICKGSSEYRAFVWISFFVAFFTTQGVNWGWRDDDMSFTFKGVITGITLWGMTGAFHMAKLCRDRRDPTLIEGLNEQCIFQVMVVASWLLSSCLIALILFLDIGDWQKFFLAAGWGYELVSVYTLVKHLRDRREALHIIAAAESPEPAKTGPVLLDQIQKAQQYGQDAFQSPRQVSNSIQPIMELTAPLERRGQAAKLIGQRSLQMSPEEIAHALEGGRVLHKE